MFASRITKEISLGPVGLPNDTATIRRLSGKHLAKAAEARQCAAVQTVQAIGGASALKELQALSTEEKKDKGEKADPLNAYDAITLITKGVLAWSVPEPLTSESFDDLDEDATVYLATEVLRLTKPSLFDPTEGVDAETKNA